MTVLAGQKHLVKCRCVLPQFKNALDPVRHQFVVFSVLKDDVVVPKYAQCTNCGLVHRVTELGKSEILAGREHMSSIVGIDDIKASLPEQLTALLEKNGVDLPTWEAAQFIIENSRWGDNVVLTTDTEGNTKHGKLLRIMGTGLFKVEAFSREEAPV